MASGGQGEEAKAQPRTLPLRRLLFVAFAGMAVLLLLVAGASWGRYFFLRSRNEAMAHLKETAFLTSLRLGAYLERHRQLVVMLAREMEEEGTTDPVRVRPMLLRVRETNPGLLTMLVTGADGAIWMTVPETDVRRAQGGTLTRGVADRSYFKVPAHTRQPHVSNAFLGRGFGIDPIVAVSAPLRDKNGDFNGVVEASLDLSRLAEFESGRDLIETGDIVIVDAAGVVVYGTDRRRYPPLRAFTDVRFERPAGSEARALAGRAALPERDKLAAKDVLYGWAPLRVSGMEGEWIVAVLQDQSEISAVVWRQLGYLALGLIGAIMMSAVAADYLAHRVTRPVVRLAGFARLLARRPGAEDVPVQVPTHIREISEMQADFAAMNEQMRGTMAGLRATVAEKEALAAELIESRAALEVSHQKLESRVAERTREQEQAVAQLVAEVARRTRSEGELERRNRTMISIALGRPLRETLESIVAGVESEDAEMFASIMLMASDGRTLQSGAALRLPRVFWEALDGHEIGPLAGACGTAAHRRERVIVADIATDPKWARHGRLMEMIDFKACWATPVFGEGRELLGVFVVYYRRTGSPTEDHLRIVDAATHTAAVAIARERAARERERLEEQLRAVKKIEALGTLAGGVAHGFNNLLVPILSYAELLLREQKLTDSARQQLAEIIRAGRQARNLVQQMLAFSRQDNPLREPIRLGAILTEAVALLRSSAPATVELTMMLSENDPVVSADAAQIHQLLLNLGHNALQAVAGNGRVSVTTYEVEEEGMARLLPTEKRVGRHVCVQVTDSGSGMVPEVMDRIFEPFFTTKSTGVGSGLGLAVVHGIVRAHGGAITVESTPGHGATFRVFLPVVVREAVASTAKAVRLTAGLQLANTHVLLVDDEEIVAQVASMVLRSFGCSVDVVASGEAALELLQANAGTYSLLITDVAMPGMSGVDLALALRQMRSKLPVLFITGHGGFASERLALLTGRFKVLAKPFEMAEFSSAVSELVFSEAK
jgi:signal transduction histidine kinase/ActR/RegA family two-component response regulator/Skp family chaperone for outer membrane proteins